MTNIGVEWLSWIHDFRLALYARNKLVWRYMRQMIRMELNEHLSLVIKTCSAAVAASVDSLVLESDHK